MNDSPVYWFALKKIKGIGDIKYVELLEKYKDPELILKKIIKPDNLQELIDFGEKIYEKCLRHKIEVITYFDKYYPEDLKNIHSSPPFLFYKGNKELLLKKDKVAVVGSRNPSSYGKKIIDIFIPELLKFNIIIVSGLAKGIDGYAHRVVLNEKGDTIAVTGSGLDIKYPSSNKKLYDEISEKGLIISEFFPGTPPEAPNFPKRNRIISAISKGVVVIEAGKKSGSIITAMHAVEQGKDVFAFPGNIFSFKSMGNHFLIKNGAYLIENTKDLLEILFPEKLKISDKYLEKPEPEFSNEKEKYIYEILKNEPLSFDNIVAITSFDFSEIFTILSNLQLKGLVYEQPGKIYTAI